MIYDRPRSKFFNPFLCLSQPRNNVQNLTGEFHRPECKFPGSRAVSSEEEEEEEERVASPRPISLRDFKTKRLK